MGFGGMSIEPKPGFWRDFWSDVDNQVDLTDSATATGLPDIVVSGLPSGMTLQRVMLLLKVRAIENTSATGTNAINGAQNIVIKKDSEAWGSAITAINLADNMWEVPALTKESGDILVGDIDIKATVEGDDTYNIRIEDALVDYDNLRLHDVQVGLRFFWEI